MKSIASVVWTLLVILGGQQVIVANGSSGDDDKASRIYGDPSRIRILNLGTINHNGLDYAPTVSADGKTVFFVSERSGSLIHAQQGETSHDFWRVKKEDVKDTSFSDPVNLVEINTMQDEGVASISADRQTLYYTVCDRQGGFGSCDLWEAQVAGDRFVKPRVLGKNVNSPYWESQPYIAPDGSRLYFSSNRPRSADDSYRVDDYDIWYSDWDPANNEWLPARNLGPDVNTDGREASPYIAPDSKTLFFSSDGRKPNIGGMDFYYTTRVMNQTAGEPERWTGPLLVPAPINSPEDDQFISMPVSGEVLYFSSKRMDIPGWKGDFDLYMAEVPKVIGAVNLIVSVEDGCTEDVIPSKVTITNELTDRQVTANVDATRRDVNIVLSDKDFIKDGTLYDSLTLLIEATSPAIGLQRRELHLPISILESTDDIEETFTINQTKRLAADLQSREGHTKIAFKVNEETIQQRLLPYVFFDRNSAEIPRRYRQIRNDQVREFREVFPPRTALTDYYHVLNIVGSRLSKLSGLQLTISGHRDEPSECDQGLSQQRAEKIRTYLNSVWGIPVERMKIMAGGFPRNRSNPEDTLAAAENRRCELSVSGPEDQRDEFERPLTSIWSNLSSSIPTVRFLVGRRDVTDTKERRIELRMGDKVIRSLEINPSEEYVTWDVARDAQAILEAESSTIRASVVEVGGNGRECPLDTTSIPVQSQAKPVARQATRPVIYRVHSFEVGTFEVDALNLRFLKNHAAPGLKKSPVLVTGMTDIVGMYDHNMYVSERLAESVATSLGTLGVDVNEDELRGYGEDRPRYSNRFPEGRFYNRAVELTTARGDR